MSATDVAPAADEDLKENEDPVLEGNVTQSSAHEQWPLLTHETKLISDDSADQQEPDVPQKEIIRYSLQALLSLRNSKLSQAKPACKNLELSCMAHHKPPPKMLIANMMPKFALNQMQNRGEESVSPLSFHSNSSSSSNLSYQKRYQDGGREVGGREGGEGYANSRYYYNKYNKYDDNPGSSRIIYKTTGANANNGNNIRFLKKAYNSKYENQESSVGLISNKNILENSSRVITAADHRNSKKIVDLSQDDDDKKIEKGDDEKKSPSDEKNNNEKSLKDATQSQANASEQLRNSAQNDLKNLPDDITNRLDDMFNNLNMNQLLPEKTDERESSRFSKWFTVNKDDAKDEKIPDVQNNNNDSVSFPQSVESEKYFQPIDRVESNSLFQLLKGPPNAQKEENPLMHIIHQQQKQQQQQQQQKSPSSGGQVHSVEELESRLRHHKVPEEQHERKNNESEQKVLQNFFQQQMPNMTQQHHHQQQPMVQNQEDVNAFKKLLSQMAGDENKMPAQMTPNGQNLLQQMMAHGNEVMMQKQKGFPRGAKIFNPVPSQGAPNMVTSPTGPQGQFIQFMQQGNQIPEGNFPVRAPDGVQAIVQGKNMSFFGWLQRHCLIRPLTFRFVVRRDFTVQFMATIDDSRLVSRRTRHHHQRSEHLQCKQ